MRCSDEAARPLVAADGTSVAPVGRMVRGNHEFVRCPRCGERTIATRPLPMLNQPVQCERCGHREAFGGVLKALLQQPTEREERVRKPRA